MSNGFEDEKIKVNVVETPKNVCSKTTVQKTVKSGITFGSCLAIVISYTAWHSIPWAFFHGILSWVYVLYYLIKY